MRRLSNVFGLLALLALLAVSFGPASAAPGKGNNDNAKLCQKGGWEELQGGEDGTSFASEGACVSYGAQGGTVEDIPDATPTRSFSVVPASEERCWGTASVTGFPTGTVLSFVYIDTSTTTGQQFGYSGSTRLPSWLVRMEPVRRSCSLQNWGNLGRTDVHTEVLIDGVSVFGPATMTC